MKIKELQNMGREELLKQLSSMREQVRDLSFKIHSREIKNSHTLKVIKKDVARILTLINQDEKIDGEVKRQLTGQITSNKMNKTVIVKVDMVKVHPKYHKRFTVSKKYPAHVEENIYMIGDKVVIEETRPISKTVNWKVISKA